jgi:hypothetical protein
MHTIMSKKFYLGPKFGTLFLKKWITISELLHKVGHKPDLSCAWKMHALCNLNHIFPQHSHEQLRYYHFYEQN